MIRVRVDRQSLNMGDDMRSHAVEWELPDDATLVDILRRSEQVGMFPASGRTPWLLQVLDGRPSEGGRPLVLVRVVDSVPASVSMVDGGRSDQRLATFATEPGGVIQMHWTVHRVDSELPWAEFLVDGAGGSRRRLTRPLKLAVSRSSVHAADDGGRMTWEVPDGARWGDLAVVALESGFLLRDFEWVLLAQGRALVRIRWPEGGGEVEVATTRHARDAVAATWDRRGDGRVSWETAPLVRVWWVRAPRFRVDAALTARARDADRGGRARADG